MEFFAGIGAGWMNLASLALGLLAWMLPVAAMILTAAGRARCIRRCLWYASALPPVRRRCIFNCVIMRIFRALRMWELFWIRRRRLRSHRPCCCA